MQLSDIPADQVILGARRSGAYWLTKIFDSHSDVLYRHESDAGQAKRYGLTAARFNALLEVEQFAWNSAVLNETAIDDLKDTDDVKVLRDLDMCEQPLPETQRLFRFTGPDWNDQIKDFIAAAQPSADRTGIIRLSRIHRPL